MFRRLLNNQLYKVISYNGVVVSGKLLASFVVSKVSAIYLGPAGFAIIGNFKNVLTVLLGLTSGGFESGVIRYIAENRGDERALDKVVANVIAFNVLFALVLGPVLYFFSGPLADYALQDQSLAYIIQYLAVFFPLVSLSFLLVYILNGLQEFKTYTLVLTIGSVLTAVVTFVLIHYYDLEGALFASMVIPAMNFLVILMFKRIRVLFFQGFLNLKRVSFNFFRSISVYLFMAMYSTVLISTCYFLIRNGIIDEIDIETAGLWEAMNKVSTFYMIFFSSLMTLYLLPKLSENKTMIGFNNIMKDYFKTIVPLAIVTFIIIFVLRLFIIELFLTDAFISIERYFYLQLIGDFFKVIGFSLAYQFHAKRMVLPYLLTDALLYGVFYFGSIYLLKDYQLIGVFYAYVASAFLYLVFVSLSIFLTRHNQLKQHE